MLSWAAWKSDFAADPNIVGKTVRINKQPYTIVGVTPEGFYGTEKFGQPDIFVPLANEASLDGVNWLESRSDRRVWSVVRIKDGVTMPQVQAELNTIAARIRAAVSQRRRKAIVQADPPRPDRRLFRRAGARFSGWGDGAGWHRTARRLRQPRQPVRGANGRPHSRNCDPHGHWIQPLAHRPPDPGRGRHDLTSRGRVRLRVSLDRPHRPGELASPYGIPSYVSHICRSHR